jgi:nucleoside-diphosphate-sugar epimerase
MGDGQQYFKKSRSGFWMTRFLADELSTAHWFDISAAKKDLGYVPKISIEEGLSKLEGWFQNR